MFWLGDFPISKGKHYKILWVSVRESHTSMLNVKLSVLSVHRSIRCSIHHGWHASSAGHSYHARLLSSCVPIVLSHSISFIKRVCPTVRPRLSKADRWSRKGWPLRFGMNELLHCIAYASLCLSISLTVAPQCSTFT